MVVWGIQSKFKVSFLVRATLEKWAVWDLNAVPLDKAKNQESGDSRWQQSHLASALVCVYRWQERCLVFWFSGVAKFCACPYPFSSIPNVFIRGSLGSFFHFRCTKSHILFTSRHLLLLRPMPLMFYVQSIDSNNKSKIFMLLNLCAHVPSSCTHLHYLLRCSRRRLSPVLRLWGHPLACGTASKAFLLEDFPVSSIQM